MEYNKYSDEELFLHIQNNKGEGFEEIINRYQTKLLRYVTSLNFDSESAQDVVQETFISAYQNQNNFDTKRKFSSWIYRIAHNKAINEWRKNKGKLSLEEVKETEGKINAQEISKEIDQRDAAKKVKEQIGMLPEKYRSIILLRHYEEKSYEEISDILRIPVSTVGVRIKRGLELLKKKTNVKIEDYL